jgi:hypothetical protein
MPLERMIHLILWPFNAAVYAYSIVALATGSAPQIDWRVTAGVFAFVVAIAAVVWGWPGGARHIARGSDPAPDGGQPQDAPLDAERRVPICP